MGRTPCFTHSGHNLKTISKKEKKFFDLFQNVRVESLSCLSTRFPPPSPPQVSNAFPSNLWGLRFSKVEIWSQRAGYQIDPIL